MQTTPISNRLHIGIFGRRNAGKSTLLNSIVGQNTAITSDQPGTTTDPVYKTMELIPFGPVVIIDTAGIDDQGDLGELRIKKTIDVIDKTDLALIVLSGNSWSEEENELYLRFIDKKTPIIVILNKIDQYSADQLNAIRSTIPADLQQIAVSALTNQGIDTLKETIIKNAPEKFETTSIIKDLINPNDYVVLVVPIDYEAPKGRLILPQVQVLREVLDCNAIAVTVKETELASVLLQITKPKLVITDSQAFKQVAKVVPSSVALTSFSILFARHKGDLDILVRGAAAIDHLTENDKILIAEACSHHIGKDDIAREKLPRWLKEYTGFNLQINYVNGNDFPSDINEYKLVIHCGACMFNRQGFMSRIMKAEAQSVPITNFGVCIAKLMGILDRAVSVFNNSE